MVLKLAPRWTLILPPPFSILFILGGEGRPGVTCLFLKVSKHRGESPLAVLKKVGILGSWRPASSSTQASQWWRNVETKEARAASPLFKNHNGSCMCFVACFVEKLPSCWCLPASIHFSPLQFFLGFLSCTSPLCLLPPLFILALPSCQTPMLWYPSFSVSAAMTHVPIQPPLSTLLEEYSKSSRNKQSPLLPIENFLPNKASRHSTGWIFGLLKRIPPWRALVQSHERV